MRWHLRSITCTAVLMTWLAASSALQAAVVTWNGADANWGTSSNWTWDSGSGLPGSTDDVVFYGGSATTFATTLGADFAIHSLSFGAVANNVSIGAAGAETLTLGSGGINVSAGSTATQHTISADLLLDAHQTWTNNSAASLLQVTGNVIASGDSYNLTIAGAGNTAISGGISLDTGSLIKDGAGTLTLSGSNSFSGGTHINDGTVRVGSSGALGSNGLYLTSTTAVLDLNAYSVSVNGVWGNSVDQSQAGTILNNGLTAAVLTIGSGNGDSRFYGNITDGTGVLGLRVTGSGITSLYGVNTFTGGLAIVGGGTVRTDSNAALGANGGNITFSDAADGGNLEVATANLGGRYNVDGIGTISVASGLVSSFTGNLTGSGTLIKSGDGDLVVLTDTDNFSGDLVLGYGALNAGAAMANFRLLATAHTAQPTGTLHNVDSITINPGSLLQMDYSRAGAISDVNFVNDTADIILAGGMLQYNGRSGAASTEVLGDLYVAQGVSLVTSSNTAGSVSTSFANLTFSSITSQAGAVLFFSGNTGATASLGNNSRIFIGGLADGFMGGNYFALPSGTRQDFVKYVAGNGVVALADSDYAILTSPTGADSYFTVGNNVKLAQLSGSNLNIDLTPGDYQINSLSMHGANFTTGNIGQQNLTLTGSNLDIVSGGVIVGGNQASGALNYRILGGNITSSGGNLTFFTYTNRTLLLTSNITDSGATPVSVTKVGPGTMGFNQTSNNTYTGGTYILGGNVTTLATDNVRYFGEGQVFVTGANLILSGNLATGYAGGPDYVASNGGQIHVNRAQSSEDNWFSIDGNSVIQGTTSILASLTYNNGTLINGKGKVDLADNAIVAHMSQLTLNPASPNSYSIQNLPLESRYYYGLGIEQNNPAGNLTIGDGTPWKGVATNRTNVRWRLGTITVDNSSTGTVDVYLRGLATANTTVAAGTNVTLGLGFLSDPSGPVMNLTNPGTANVNIVGLVQSNNQFMSFGDPASGRYVTFQVTPGAYFDLASANSLGSGAKLANVTVQAGGVARVGNVTAVNGDILVRPDGRLIANSAGMEGTGQITFREDAIIQITNPMGFTGTQALNSLGRNDTIVRLLANIGSASARVLGDGTIFNGNPVFQIDQNVRPVDPVDDNGAVLLLNSVARDKGVLTNDYSDRIWYATTTGSAAWININGTHGGTIASTTGTFLQVTEDIRLNGGTLYVGYNGSLNGFEKLGRVMLNDVVGDATLGGTVQVVGGAELMTSATWNNSANVNMLLESGSRFDVNNAVVLRNVTGTGNIVGASVLTIGEDSNFTFDGVLGNTTNATLRNTVGLRKVGSGTLNLTQSAISTGATTINAGTIQLGADEAITHGTLTLGNATAGTSGLLVLNGFNQEVRGLAAAGPGGSIVNGSAALVTLTVNSTAATAFNGTLGNATAGNDNNFNFVKKGTSTLTLNGTSYYTGTTEVQNGILVVTTLGNVNGGGSALGAPESTAAGTITLGSSVDATAGTLRVDGATAPITDRDLVIAYTGSGLSANGTVGSPLTWAGSISGLSGDVILTLNGNNTDDNTIAGTISDGTATSLGVTKLGTGKWILGAANTYTGLTTVTGGNLVYGVDNAIGGGNVLVNGGTLDFSTYSDTIVQLVVSSGAVTGSGALTSTSDYIISSGTVSMALAGDVGLLKNTTGTATLSGLNTYTGQTTVEEGKLIVTTLGNVGAGASSLGAPTTVGSGTIVLGNATQGNATLQWEGATANITDRNLSLAFTSATLSANGTAPITLGGTIDSTNTGAVILTLAGNSGAMNTITGVIDEGSASSLSLVKIDSGRWILDNAANGFSGSPILIKDGALGFTSAGALNGAAVTVGDTATMGTLEYAGSAPYTFTQALTLTGLGGGIGSSGTGIVTLSSDVFTKTGPASLVLSGTNTGDNLVDMALSDDLGGAGTGALSLVKRDAGKWILNAANSYTGETTINGGELFFTNSQSFANVTLGGEAGLWANMTLGSGVTATMVGTNVTYLATNNGLGSAISGGTLDLGSTARDLVIGDSTNAPVDLEIASKLSGTAGFTKLGAGTLLLSNGANDFSGQLTIAAGTVQATSFGTVGSPSALGASGTVNFTGATKLEYVGSGETSNLNLVMTGANATLAASGTGTLTFTGTVSSDVGRRLTLSGNGNGILASNLALALANADLYKDGTGTWTITSAQYVDRNILAGPSHGQALGSYGILAGNVMYAFGRDEVDTLYSRRGAIVALNAQGAYVGGALNVEGGQVDINVANAWNDNGGYLAGNMIPTTLSITAGGILNLNQYSWYATSLTFGTTGWTSGVSPLTTGEINGDTASPATLYVVGGIAATGNATVPNVTGYINPGVNVVLTTTAAATRTVTTNLSGTSVNIGGNLTETSGFAATLQKLGSGTLRLAGTNSYTGATLANAGTLILDYTSSTGGKLADAAELRIAGATVQLLGNATENVVETVGSANITGRAEVVLTSAAGQDLTFNLNTINRGLGGALRITYDDTAGGTSTVTTDNQNVNGILGGWLTVYNALTGTYDWGYNADGTADGAIRAYTGYVSTFNAGDNTNVTAGVHDLSAGSSSDFSNSLRFNDGSGAATVILPSTGVSLLASGGVMVTPTVGANDITITGGALTVDGQSPYELFLLQNNPSGNLIIESPIVNYGSSSNVVNLSKHGVGKVILAAANTYGGATYVTNGSLELGVANALPITTVLTLGDSDSAGILRLAGHNQQLAGLLINANAIGAPTLNKVVNDSATHAVLTIANPTGLNYTFSGVLGGSTASENNFSLVKAGGGTLTLNATESFTGTTTVWGGNLALNYAAYATQKLATANRVILDGGTLHFNMSTLNAAITQTVAGLTIDGGGSIVQLLGNGSTNTNQFFNFNGSTALTTRNAFSTINFLVTGNLTSGRPRISLYDGVTTEHLLGGWATYVNASNGNNTQWAALLANNNVVGAESLVTNVMTDASDVSTWTAGINVQEQADAGYTGTLASNLNINSLRFNYDVVGSDTVGAVDLGGYTLGITSGGILLSNTGTAGSDKRIVNGNLTSNNANGELIVNQYSARNLYINATIVNQNLTQATSLIKTGQGNLYLYGANSYTGDTYIQRGAVIVNNLADNGTDSSLGNSGVIHAGSIGDVGLYYNGAAPASINRTIDLYSGNLNLANNNTVTTNLLHWTGNITSTTLGPKALSLYSAAGVGKNEISGVISDGPVAGSTVSVRTVTGNWLLTGNNTYTGYTDVVGGGFLSFTTLGNLGEASSLGAPTDAELGTIRTGSGSNAYITYVGTDSAGVDTNRSFRIMNTDAGEGTILGSNGTGAFVLRGNVTLGTTNTNARLWLRGNNTAVVNEIAGVISDGTLGGKLGLTIDNNVTWRLSNTNTYSSTTAFSAGTLELAAVDAIGGGGAITVSGGTLKYLNDDAIGTSAITVSGGTWDLNGFSDTVGLVTVSGGTINGNLAGGAVGTLSSTSNFDFQSGNITANLAGDVGGVKTTSGTVVITGAIGYTGNTTINAGSLRLGTDEIFTNDATIIINGSGALDLGSYTQSLDGAGLSGSGIVTNSAAGTTSYLNLDYGGASGVLSVGIVDGAGRVVVNLSGTGSYALTGPNAGGTLSYSGGGAIDLSNVGRLADLNMVDGGTVSAGYGYVSGNVTAGDATTLYVPRNTVASIGGLAGSGAVTKTGSGELRLEGASSFNGTLYVAAENLNRVTLYGSSNGATLPLGTLTDADITLGQASTLYVNLAKITSSLAGEGVLNDQGTITLNAATLQYVSPNVASWQSENIGNIVLGPGASTIVLNRTNAAGADLTLNSLTAQTGGVAFFNALTGTLGSTSKIFITGQADGFLGGQYMATAATTRQDFLKYDSVNGVQALTDADYQVVSTGTFDANVWTSSNNIKLEQAASALSITLGASSDIQSLNMHGPNVSGTAQTLTIGAGKVLNVTSGGINVGGNTASNALTYSIAAGTLTSSSNVLNFFTQTNRTLTLSSAVANYDSNALSVVKAGAGTLTMSAANSFTGAVYALGGTTNITGANVYTGGTYVIGATLETGLTNGVAYLGSGPVYISNSQFNMRANGSTSYDEVTYGGYDYTVTDGSRFYVRSTQDITDTISIAAGSELYFNTSANLTRVKTVGAGGTVTLADGAIITTAVVYDGTWSTSGILGGLGSDPKYYFGAANTDNTATLQIGENTPWKGIAATRGGAQWRGGTIQINVDGTTGIGEVDFSGFLRPTGYDVLTLGNTTLGTVAITLNQAGNADINVIGPVTINADEVIAFGNRNNSQNIRFVVTSGSLLTTTTVNALGSYSAGTYANVLVKDGGSMAIGNAGAVSGNVSVAAGGRFVASQASLTGSGALSFDAYSILELTNATGWTGTQATSATGVEQAIVRVGVAAPGTAGTANTPGTETTLATMFSTGTNIFELSVATVTPVNPITGLNTTVLYLNGGGLTNAGLDATFAATGNGTIKIGSAGGSIASSTGYNLTVTEDIQLGGNTITIGSNAALNGYGKLGRVILANVIGNVAGSKINVVSGAELAASGNWTTANTTLNLASGSVMNIVNVLATTPFSAVTGEGSVTSKVANANITIGGDSLANWTYDGTFDGTLAVIKAGNKQLTLAGSSQSTNTGNFTVSNGTLAMGAANVMSPYSRLVLGSGTVATHLILNGYDQEIGGLRLGNATLATSAVRGGNDTVQANLAVNVASGTDTFAGTLGGSTAALANFALTKKGAGVLDISGAISNYVGNTTVQAGTLRVFSTANVDNTSPVTTSQFVLAGGALGGNGRSILSLGAGAGYLQFVDGAAGGFSAIGGNLAVNVNNDGGTLVWGSTPFFDPSELILNDANSDGTLTFANGLNLNGSSRTIYTGAAEAVVAGQIVGTGSLDKTGDGTLTLNNYNQYSGATLISGGAVQGQFGKGLPSTTNIVFDGGTLQGWTTGTADLQLGSGAGQVSWLGSGGFAARGGDLALTLNGGAALTWGSTTDFVGDGSVLMFGSNTSDGLVDLQNNIDLGGAERIVQVVGSVARLSGVISGSEGLRKTGAGVLELTNTNTFSGNVAVENGTISVASITDSGVNGVLGAGSSVTLGATGTNGTLAYTGSGSSTDRALNITGAGGVLQADGSGALVWNGAVDSVATGTHNLTLTGSSDASIVNAVNGAIANTLGTLNLLKTGDNTWYLGATNTYTGTTIVNGGVLRLGAIGAISTAATTITSGTLDLNGYDQTVTTFTLGGGAAGTSATADLGSATLRVGGNVTYTATNNPLRAEILDGTLDLNGANRNINVGDSTATGIDMTISASISDAGSGFGITKHGAGTLELTGANSYYGVTTITTGALQAAIGTGLPSTSNVQFNGGVLQATGDVAYTLGANGGEIQWLSAANGGFAAYGNDSAVTLNGGANLVWNNTAYFVATGSLAFGSTSATNMVTLTNDLDLNGAARTVTVTDNALNNPDAVNEQANRGADIAVLSGVVSNGTLTKAGTGALRLTNASNSFAGPITISAGVLEFTTIANVNGGTSSLGSPTTAANGNITIVGATAAGTGLRFVGSTDQSSDRNIIAGGGNALFPTLDASGSGKWTVNGVVDLTGNATTYHNLALSGTGVGELSTVVLSSNTASDLYKYGSGTWILSGNFNTDDVFIYGGTLKAGAHNIFGTGADIADAVLIGTATQQGTLDLAGYTVTMGGLLNMLNGTIIGDPGAKFYVTNVMSNTTDTSIESDVSVYLTSTAAATRTFTVGNKTLTVDGAVLETSGFSANLTKAGAGTLVLTNAGNDWTGNTTVSAGALRANWGTGLPTTSNLILAGGVLEGSGTFAGTLGTTGGTLQFTAASGGGFAAYGGNLAVTLNSGDPLVFNSTANFLTTGNLVFGSLTADSRVQFTNNLDLNGASRTVNVVDNIDSTGDYALISGTILNSNATAAGLVKAGNGTLELSAANTYNGATSVDAGVLMLSNNQALGASDGTAATGTTVAGTYRSLYLNGVTVTDEALVLSGTGGAADADLTTANGALRAISGDNVWTGPISLTSGGGDALIKVDAGATLSLQGAITLNAANRYLVLGGQGSGNVTGAIGQTAGSTLGLNKIDAGTWTLAGANSYTGSTLVSGGVLRLANSSALGGSAASVSGGAALEITGGIAVANALTLTGTGIADGGALRSTSNGNMYLGNIVVLDSARVNSDVGTLILGSNTSSITGGQLTVGGAGNTTLLAALNMTSFVKDGPGDAVFAGTQSNTYTGDTSLLGGNLSLAKTGGAVAIAGNIILGSATGNGLEVLALGGDNQIAPTSVITFYGSATAYDAGVLALNGFNETLGGIVSSTQGHGVIVNGSATNDSVLTVNNAADQTFYGLLLDQIPGSPNTPTLGLTKMGLGSLTLAGDYTGTGASPYTGLTTVLQGTLIFDSPSNAIGGDLFVDGGTAKWARNDQVADSSTVTLNSGTIDIGSYTDTIYQFILNDGVVVGTGQLNPTVNTTIVNNGTLNATITGNQGLNKNGSGEVTMNVTNSYTGPTVVSSGTLNLNATGGSAIPSNLTINGGVVNLLQGEQVANGQTVTVAGGNFNTNGFNETVGGLTLVNGVIGGAGTITAASNYLLQNGTVEANLAGTGIGANKTTSGTVTMFGSNTYDGMTNVFGGNLIVAAGSTIIGGANVTGSGSTLVVNGLVTGGVTASSGGSGGNVRGNGTIGGGLTIYAGGTLSAGNSAGLMKLEGDLNLNSGMTFLVEVEAATLGELVAGVGGYDQVQLLSSGDYKTALNSASLSFVWDTSLTLDPSDEAMLVVINNLGNDNTDVGRFAGLANNGDMLTGGPYGGANWYVYYNVNSSLGSIDAVLASAGTGNDVVITNVPEPSTVALLAGGVATVLGLVWRRRRRPKAENGQPKAGHDQPKAHREHARAHREHARSRHHRSRSHRRGA